LTDLPIQGVVHDKTSVVLPPNVWE